MNPEFFVTEWDKSARYKQLLKESMLFWWRTLDLKKLESVKGYFIVAWYYLIKVHLFWVSFRSVLIPFFKLLKCFIPFISKNLWHTCLISFHPWFILIKMWLLVKQNLVKQKFYYVWLVFSVIFVIVCYYHKRIYIRFLFPIYFISNEEAFPQTFPG